MSSVLNSYQQERAARRQRLLRALAIQLLVLLFVGIPLFVGGLRWFEFAATFHPVRASATGQSWNLPAGGEDVWFKVSSGERLHGWFIHVHTPEPIATILYAHGNGGNLRNVSWIAEDLAERGFNVLIFDYRGYGRSEGDVSDEHGLNADADAAYDYLVHERQVAPTRLVLYGQSLGTTAMVDVASRRECGALILESGLSSASDMASDMLPWLPMMLHRLGRNRFDSAHKLSSVHCPVLIAHGDPDHVIPAAQGRTLYAAAHEPKKLVIYPNADHNVSGMVGAPYFDLLAEFIQNALDSPDKINGATMEHWRIHIKSIDAAQRKS